jgi:hypothetical protein
MWNTDLKPGWNSLKTNISKFFTTSSDFSWPTDAPLFPRIVTDRCIEDIVHEEAQFSLFQQRQQQFYNEQEK